jgi:hypothetical protein
MKKAASREKRAMNDAMAYSGTLQKLSVEEHLRELRRLT